METYGKRNIISRIINKVNRKRIGWVDLTNTPIMLETYDRNEEEQ